MVILGHMADSCDIRKKSPVPRVLVLADDLTGALEAGALFAGRGVKCIVTLKPEDIIGNDYGDIRVIVADTQSRHLGPQNAFERIRSIAARADGFDYFFKKTDSTLRGNVAAELYGLMEAKPGNPLVFSPAYPRMGRTVTGGSLHVNGVPVSETEFARDQLNPVKESHIPSLLSASGFPLPVLTTIHDGLSVPVDRCLLITDGCTEDEIRRTARDFLASGSLRLAAGPAGFLRHFADGLLGHPPSWQPPEITRLLAINGSRHPVSSGQISHALERGWVLWGEALPPALSYRVILDTHNPILDTHQFPKDESVPFASRFAEIACQAVEGASAETAIVFGGDTAAAIIKYMGVQNLEPLGEVLPGVPIARLELQAIPNDGCPDPAALGEKGGCPGLACTYWITKAGGFGEPDLLSRIIDVLSPRPHKS
jgi:D-threonate/D-erythronate kinase